MHMHTVTANGTPDSDAMLPSTLPNNCSIRSMPTQIDPTFVPFTPADVSDSRYRNRPLVDTPGTHFRLPELTRRFPNQSCPWLTDDWKSCVHPEGALYLYKLYDGKLRAYTEANINENTFRMVDGYTDALCNMARNKLVDFTDDIELVVQLEVEQTEVSCKYYFVDHEARTLFWLVDLNEETEGIFSAILVYDLAHLGHALEQQYWFVTCSYSVRSSSFETSRMHCGHYPNHQMNRSILVKELRELVMHASAEMITSDASLSPFDAGELSRILDLIGHLQGYHISLENASDINDGSTFLHSTCVIARFMHFFYRAKFYNFCGLPYARLDADKPVFAEATDTHPLISSLFFVLEAMLFWAPRARLEALRRVWVDEGIILQRRKDFAKDLMDEWSSITIYSTVMLAVDVSFLAVPNVNIGSSQSVGIIATYLSIIFLTGSLIVSLLLAPQNRRYGAESVDEVENLLFSMTGTVFGVKALATIHSLPFAMLMWGMIYFTIALLYNVFKSATMVMLASVISGCTVVTMSILWFIWTAKISTHMLNLYSFLTNGLACNFR